MTNSAASRASKSPVTLAGRTAADLLRSGGILVLMVAVGSLLGFRWQTSLLGLLGGWSSLYRSGMPGRGSWR